MLKLLELLVVPKSIELLETESEGMPSLAALTETVLLPPLLLMLIVPSTVCPALMALRFTLTRYRSRYSCHCSDSPTATRAIRKRSILVLLPLYC